MAVKKTDRDAVIDAALTLFRVKGYHHTSIADISAACGLLKGSIYHYFPGAVSLTRPARPVLATQRRITFESCLSLCYSESNEWEVWKMTPPKTDPTT